MAQTVRRPLNAEGTLRWCHRPPNLGQEKDESSLKHMLDGVLHVPFRP